jgi:hypothetical protein
LVLTVVANVPVASDVAPFTLWALELATLCAANLTDYGLESATDGAATTGGQEYGFDGTVRCCTAALISIILPRPAPPAQCTQS